MKKKLKNLTLDEIARICKKYSCRKCPLYNIDGCEENFVYATKEALEKEIEYDI